MHSSTRVPSTVLYLAVATAALHNMRPSQEESGCVPKYVEKEKWKNESQISEDYAMVSNAIGSKNFFISCFVF